MNLHRLNFIQVRHISERVETKAKTSLRSSIYCLTRGAVSHSVNLSDVNSQQYDETYRSDSTPTMSAVFEGFECSVSLGTPYGRMAKGLVFTFDENIRLPTAAIDTAIQTPYQWE